MIYGFIYYNKITSERKKEELKAQQLRDVTMFETERGTVGKFLDSLFG